MRAKVLAFPINGPVRAGWSSQELAEIYRLEHQLGQRGLLSEIASGVTDEGDPWLVVYDPNGSDISANITRMGSRYMVVRVDAPDPVHAASLREIANALIHGTPLAGDLEPEAPVEAEEADPTTWFFVVDQHPDADAAPAGELAAIDPLPAIVTDDRLEEVGRLLLALIAGVAEMQQDAASAAEQIEAALTLADPMEDAHQPVQAASGDLGLLNLVAAEADPPSAVAQPSGLDAVDLTALDDPPHSSGDPQQAAMVPGDGTSVSGADADAAPVDDSDGPAAASAAAPGDGDAPQAGAGGDTGALSRIGESTNQDDLFIGTDGDDVIDTGFGNDTIRAGAGNDTVEAGAGDDSVDGGSGNDVLDGGAGDDTLLGGDGNDELRGGGGTNAIDTGSGNNLVISESGRDQVTLGEGQDLVVVIPRGSGNTTVTDFDEATDRLVVIGLDEGSHTSVDPNNPGTQVINVNPDTTITITGTSPLHDPLV